MALIVVDHPFVPEYASPCPRDAEEAVAHLISRRALEQWPRVGNGPVVPPNPDPPRTPSKARRHMQMRSVLGIVEVAKHKRLHADDLILHDHDCQQRFIDKRYVLP